MQMRALPTHKQSARWLTGGLVAALAIFAAAHARSALFTGEFAPSQWTFASIPIGGELEWSPSLASPESATVTSPLTAFSATTFALLNPIAGDYSVSFRITFSAGAAGSGSLTMNAPGYDNQDILPGVTAWSFDIGPNVGASPNPTTISFLLFNPDVYGDKKDVPTFTIDMWDVQIIPETSTWIAAMGLLGLGVLHVWRSKRADRAALKADLA